MDFWVSYVAYFYDLNFRESLDIVEEQDYVRRIVGASPTPPGDRACHGGDRKSADSLCPDPREKLNKNTERESTRREQLMKFEPKEDIKRIIVVCIAQSLWH